jgi:hypothetical protein
MTTIEWPCEESMTMDASTNPRHNQLLSALPREPWQRWLPHLEYVDMRYTQALITQMVQTAACNRHHSTSSCDVGCC